MQESEGGAQGGLPESGSPQRLPPSIEERPQEAAGRGEQKPLVPDTADQSVAQPEAEEEVAAEAPTPPPDRAAQVRALFEKAEIPYDRLPDNLKRQIDELAQIQDPQELSSRFKAILEEAARTPELNLTPEQQEFLNTFLKAIEEGKIKPGDLPSVLEQISASAGDRLTDQQKRELEEIKKEVQKTRRERRRQKDEKERTISERLISILKALGGVVAVLAVLAVMQGLMSSGGRG